MEGEEDVEEVSLSFSLFFRSLHFIGPFVFSLSLCAVLEKRLSSLMLMNRN